MIYLDSSAIVKLARQEQESNALRRWLAANPEPLVSSALVKTETIRAVLRTEPAALSTLPAVLATIHKGAITDDVLELAAGFPDPTLRSLDAIHLATAQRFGSALAAFVAYDKRLFEVAREYQLPVHAPS